MQTISINLSFVSLVIICSCELLALILNCNRCYIITILWYRHVVCIAHKHNISILLLTLYIHSGRFAFFVVFTICYSTLYLSPVVGVSYVIYGEIKRSGSNITICCINSWWMIIKVFTCTNKEQCDICFIVAISYWIPVKINTTVKWLAVVSSSIDCRVRI